MSVTFGEERQSGTWILLWDTIWSKCPDETLILILIVVTVIFVLLLKVLLILMIAHIIIIIIQVLSFVRREILGIITHFLRKIQLKWYGVESFFPSCRIGA